MPLLFDLVRAGCATPPLSCLGTFGGIHQAAGIVLDHRVLVPALVADQFRAGAFIHGIVRDDGVGQFLQYHADRRARVRRPVVGAHQIAGEYQAHWLDGVTWLGFQRSARADVLAAYVEGYGGLSSPQTDGSGASGISPGLGIQAGARLLIFEGYGDYTSFGMGSSVARGIVGLRAGIGLGGVRLILRGGGGVISERGGVLTGGSLNGASDLSGGVARAGIELEKKIAPTLLAGFALDGEVFSLSSNGVPTQLQNRLDGSDVFGSFHLKFEVGI